VTERLQFTYTDDVIMTEPWIMTLLEGSIPWSDDWTPETRRVEIDAELLREIIELDAGDHGLFKTLVDMFRHDTDVHLPVLRSAAAGGETAVLSNLAHSLAGEAAQIGAASLAVHCRALESAALRGDFRLCADLVDRLTEHLDQYVLAVERELERRG
jgi:HPt (histidine-containing phosphotransfer) domain-containing protein